MAFVPQAPILNTASSKLATKFSFDAALQRLTVNEEYFFELLFVINTTDNIIIYNPSVTSKGGTKDQNRTVFTFDTTSMNDADDLLIVYEPKLFVTEQRTETFLQQLVCQMKIMNVHLSLMTDACIREQDIT